MSTGTVRQPRAWLVAFGGKINLLSCEVEVGSLQTDHKFEAVMALDDPTTPEPSEWTGTAPIPAAIVATNGDDTSGDVTLINGGVDKLIIDFDSRIVTVYGSDITSEVAATRNDQKYENQTTVQVVSQIAANHGCNINAGSLANMAGRTFDNQNYAFNSNVETDWDVIQSCAQQDGVTAFINNNTLYYGTYGGGSFQVNYTPPTTATYETGNFMKLRCERDIEIATGVDATAASWNTRDKSFYSTTKSGGGIGLGGGHMQSYIQIPGLTPAQTATEATRTKNILLDQLDRVTVETIGDVNIDPVGALVISGTQSDWDTEFGIKSVIHHFSIDDGYRMTICAQNPPAADELSADAS